MHGLTLSWLAERNAYKFPDKEAIVMTPLTGGRTAVTNAEFNERITRVANGLRERGIKRTDKVAVYTANSITTLETYLGAMRIGALPVPVNHRFKADEVRYVLEDSDADLLLFDDQATDIVDEIHEFVEYCRTIRSFPVTIDPTTRTSTSSSANQHRPTPSTSFRRELTKRC